MPTYTSKYSSRNNNYKEKFARGQASSFGFARFGKSRFGYARNAYTGKYTAQNNIYTSKYT